MSGAMHSTERQTAEGTVSSEVPEQPRLPLDWGNPVLSQPTLTDWGDASALATGFDYARCSRIFGHRIGRGPLVIAWDTNILIDYQEHGDALWNEDVLPEVDIKYRDELEALQTLVMGLFWWRSVVIRLSDRHLQDDGGKPLPSDRHGRRSTAVRKLAEATSLTIEPVDAGVDRSRSGSVTSPDDLLKGFPTGHDRVLVADAMRAGCHVFLTRDEGILKASAGVWPHIAVLRPSELVRELAGHGELSFETSSVARHAVFPDLLRLAKIIEALGA